MKVYCRPIVLDLQLPIAKLDGDQLSLVRVPIQVLLTGDNSAMLKEVDGFQEVSPEEFSRLAVKHASDESLRNFRKEFEKAYQ